MSDLETLEVPSANSAVYIPHSASSLLTTLHLLIAKLNRVVYLVIPFCILLHSAIFVSELVFCCSLYLPLHVDLLNLISFLCSGLRCLVDIGAPYWLIIIKLIPIICIRFDDGHARIATALDKGIARRIMVQLILSLDLAGLSKIFI